ncbi:hypothetical protein LguiA_013089 [Lonicera macranthoides]
MITSAINTFSTNNRKQMKNPRSGLVMVALSFVVAVSTPFCLLDSSLSVKTECLVEGLMRITVHGPSVRIGPADSAAVAITTTDLVSKSVAIKFEEYVGLITDLILSKNFTPNLMRILLIGQKLTIWLAVAKEDLYAAYSLIQDVIWRALYYIVFVTDLIRDKAFCHGLKS